MHHADLLVNSLTQSTLKMEHHRVPGTVRLALHANCDFYKDKGCWRYNQQFCVETEMSTHTSLSDLTLRLMDTIAPVAGHKGKITSISSRLPGKKFNGNPVHLKKIETEEDLDYLLQICKTSLVVNKDIYRVDVFVDFEPLNLEEEYGKDVAQFLMKLKNDKAYEEQILAQLEEMNQEEWEDDVFQMDEDIIASELATTKAKEDSTENMACPSEDGPCAISLEKIGAYRPASTANTFQDDHIVVQEDDVECAGDEKADADIAACEEMETVADISSYDKTDTVATIAVCDKLDTLEHHTPEKGDIAADIVSVKTHIAKCNVPKEKTRMQLPKKVKRSGRALSKLFGLFSCFATPSCLA